MGATQSPRVPGAKLVAPQSDRFPADLDPPLRQEILTIAVTEIESVVEPNRVLDEVLSGQPVFQHNTGMNIPNSLYRRRRFPAEIITHAVFLYHRFALSLRDVEDLLAERGVTVSYETIRVWCAHFGPKFAS